MKKQSFTLTELVIVMTVCLGLGLMLSSIVDAAVANNESVFCKNNLKRLGEAAFAYADANNDISIPHVAGNPRIIGWPKILSGTADAAKGCKDYYACPADQVERKVPGQKISYSLNTGHLWGFRYRRTTKQEWGPCNMITSSIHGNSVSFNQVEEPSNTSYFFENQWQGNTWDNLWKSGKYGDRTRFATWDLSNFPHNNGMETNMLFMDGHVETIIKGSWARGDKRSVVFKSLHTNCMGNIEGKD
jgi:prepilin-type processing-associated H-X9-DG protein